MEALRILAITVGVSLAAAGAMTWLVSLAMEPLERMRQRWAARESEAVKVVPA